MANNFNTATNVDVLTQSFLYNLQIPLKRLEKFTVDFSKEAYAFGASITTQITQASVAASVRSNSNSSYNSSDSGTTDIVITLNNDDYVQFYLNMNDMTSSPVNLEQRVVRPWAYALATLLEQQALANITSANYTNSVACISGNFGYNTVSAMATQASLLAWPLEGRSLFLHPNYVQQLRNDPALTKLFSAAAETAVLDGVVARVAGFDIYESATLSLSGSTGGNGYVGFACLPQAMCIAARPSRGQDMNMFPGDVKYTESDNGLTIKSVRYYNPDYDQLRIRFSTLFGSAVGDPSALIRITNS